MAKDQDTFREYCNRVGWDPGRVIRAFGDEGIADERLYLERPNHPLIETVSEYLTTGCTSIVLIQGAVGMGKSSLRDYVMRSLRSTPQYVPIPVTNPGMLTPLQLLKEILRTLEGGPESPHRDLGQVRTRIINTMVAAYTNRHAQTVVWVDEADKLDPARISLVRELADTRTDAGEKVCKLILTATPRFVKRLESLMDASTASAAEAAAFDDRVGIQACDMQPWSTKDVRDWVDLVAAWVSLGTKPTNPFTSSACDQIHQYSQGKPRTVAQLANLAFRFAATTYQHTESTQPTIAADTVNRSLKSKLATSLTNSDVPKPTHRRKLP